MNDLIAGFFLGRLDRSRFAGFILTALGAVAAAHFIALTFGMGGVALAPTNALKTLMFRAGQCLGLFAMPLIGVMVLGAIARRLRDAAIDARWSAFAAPPLAVSLFWASRPFIAKVAYEPDILDQIPVFGNLSVGAMIILTAMVAILCVLPGTPRPDLTQPDAHAPDAALSHSQAISKSRFFGIMAGSNAAFVGLGYIGTLEVQRLDIDFHSLRQGVDGYPFFADFVFAFMFPYAPATFILVLLILVRGALHFYKKIELTRRALLICCSPPLLSFLFAVLFPFSYHS